MEQALALLLLPAIGQAHVLARLPPPDGARHTAAAGVTEADKGGDQGLYKGRGGRASSGKVQSQEM